MDRRWTDATTGGAWSSYLKTRVAPKIIQSAERQVMIGQGSPIEWRRAIYRPATARQGRRLRRLLACACSFTLWFVAAASCWGDETTVRVRLAWGSGGDVSQRWSGQISIEGAVLSDLQPLGMEADEAAALRLEANRLIVAPLMRRSFDGCDITVQADRGATLLVELRSEQSPQPKRIEVALAEFIRGNYRAPLDDFGSFFLAHRSPGDKLRVIPPSDSLVFSPGEQWRLRLQPDLAQEAAAGSVLLSLQLRAEGENEVLWQASQPIHATTPAELSFDINCPAQENVYRVTIEARAQVGFANRLVPWQQAELFASRDVEFVVIDPAAKLPPLVDQWLPVLTVNPANPSWWQRLPSWAQVSRLRGRPPGAVGNVRPVVRPGATGDLVELPPAEADRDPFWQAYTLPVNQPGKPHLVEVEYPAGQEQHLSISVIEPDAAGRVMTPNADAGVFISAGGAVLDGKTQMHRIVFWPRTRSPQLLLVNQHESLPAQFGKLSLLRHDEQAAAEIGSEVQPTSTRLIAGYVSKPLLAANFGAAEVLDDPSGLSVQGWSTFLHSARRYAQYLKLCGYNGALITVAADGSALYPSDVMNPSPRYDTGLLATRAQDPTRKDVLEMLLRVFDREGLRLVPTLQLATPLPRLEALRLRADPGVEGIELVDHTGNTWLGQFDPEAGLAAYYNPLHEVVQQEVSQLVAELSQRYHSHRSFAGVGLQVSGEGYGMLPGLAWALDDHTIARFTQASGVSMPADGQQRFFQRAESLVGPNRQVWQDWRTQNMTAMYARLAGELTALRDDLQLILTTEDLFAGPNGQRHVRQSISRPIQMSQVSLDHGLDLDELDQQPQITVLSLHRSGSSSLLQNQALDLRINSAWEKGELLPHDHQRGVLLYQLPTRRRLTSFDQVSPYGADQTHLTLASLSLPGGAMVRKQIVTALAQHDAQILVDGGPRQPLGQHDQLRRVLQTFWQLPAADTEVSTQAKQPLVLRVYRSEEMTTVLLLNESPWPVAVRLPLESATPCDWQMLGQTTRTTPGDPPAQGSLAIGNQLWQVELEPFDLQAWSFATSQLRVDEPEVAVDDLARQQLQERIEQIEARTSNLNIQRPYLQLQNPGFEWMDGSNRIFGWQPQGSPPAAISLEAGEAHAGNYSLRLLSEGSSEVAVESHLFPMPQTGQLVVGLFVHSREVAPDTQLRITLEDGNHGRTYHQYATLSAQQLSGDGWSRFEFPVDDVPFEVDGQMRIRFQLTGKAELLIDDVQLHDLRLDSARRTALVKRIYAARAALEEGQLVDCQRLVDGYWARYLVEYVPPAAAATPNLAKQPPADQRETEPEADPGITDRLRDLVPGFWR